MSMEELRLLAETYMMLQANRKELAWKIKNNEPDDAWLVQAGLSRGNALDLNRTERRLFTDVMVPLVQSGVHIGTFLLYLRQFTKLQVERELPLRLEEKLDKDRQLLLAKLYLNLDDAMQAVIHDMVAATQEKEPDNGQRIHAQLEESQKLAEEQAEILHQFAYAGLGAKNFKKALETYKQLSVAQYRELVERAGE